MPPPASTDCVVCGSEMFLCGACKPWKEPQCRGCEAKWREEEARAWRARQEEERGRRRLAGREKRRVTLLLKKELAQRPGWVEIRKEYEYAAEEETLLGRRIGQAPLLEARSVTAWRAEGFQVKKDQVGRPQAVRGVYFPGQGGVNYEVYRCDQVEPLVVLGARRLLLGRHSIPVKDLTRPEWEMAADSAGGPLLDSLKERGLVGDESEAT